MPFLIVKEKGRQTLNLEGSVTIRDALELAATLGEKLEDGVPLGVNTANVDDIDTCILQLLCSLSKTVPGLHFDQPSDVLIRAANRCALRRELLATEED